MLMFFFFKQKTAYEMRISDWSSDVCSSDLLALVWVGGASFQFVARAQAGATTFLAESPLTKKRDRSAVPFLFGAYPPSACRRERTGDASRSEARRVGRECVSTCRSRRGPSHYTQKMSKTEHSHSI